MAVWERPSQLCQWRQNFGITNWGACIWGNQASLESQPCNQDAKMMLCLAIVIGTLLEDCLTHPMEQRRKRRTRQRQGLLVVVSMLWDESGGASIPSRTSRKSVVVVPFRLF